MRELKVTVLNITLPCLGCSGTEQLTAGRDTTLRFVRKGRSWERKCPYGNTPATRWGSRSRQLDSSGASDQREWSQSRKCRKSWADWDKFNFVSSLSENYITDLHPNVWHFLSRIPLGISSGSPHLMAEMRRMQSDDDDPDTQKIFF